MDWHGKWCCCYILPFFVVDCTPLNSAIGLKNAGLKVHVFEAAVRLLFPCRLLMATYLVNPQSKFGEVGAGVGLSTFPCTFLTGPK